MPAPSYWNASRPPAGVAIDPAHPLAQGLLRLYVFNDMDGGNLGDVIYGRTPATLAGAAVAGRDNHGRTVFINAGGSDAVVLGTVADAGLPSGIASTILYGYHKTDNTARASAALGNDTAGDTEAYRLLLPYADGTVYFDYAGNSGGGGTRLSVGGLSFGDDFWAFTTGTRGMEIWQSGIRRGLNAVTPSRTTAGDAGTLMRLGAFPGQSLGADIAHIWYCAIYNRQLDPTEIQSVTAMPYQMFAPPVWRRYFVPVAAVADVVPYDPWPQLSPILAQ